jgi:hypothetical protein
MDRDSDPALGHGSADERKFNRKRNRKLNYNGRELSLGGNKNALRRFAR